MADALGMITGMPAATVVSDSYIVSDYVESREMVEELEKRLPLRAIYSTTRRLPLPPRRRGRAGGAGRILAEPHRRLLRFHQEHDRRGGAGVRARRRAKAGGGDRGDRARAGQRPVGAGAARRGGVRRQRGGARRAPGARGARGHAATSASPITISTRPHGDRTPGDRGGARGRALEAQLGSCLRRRLPRGDAPSVQMLKSRIAALDGEISRIEGRISHPSSDAASSTGDDAGISGLSSRVGYG